MTLHWGASHISSCLPAELAARFHEAYADPNLPDGKVTGLPVYNGKTGELIMEMGADKPVRVSRRKMRGLCGEGVEVQYGKKFVSAKVGGNGKVTVEFEDGEQVEGDVLIGCDGARSRVRSVLVGEEGAKLADAGVGMFNFPYKFDAELAGRIRGMNELFVTSIHPDHGNMFWLSSKFHAPQITPLVPLPIYSHDTQLKRTPTSRSPRRPQILAFRSFNMDLPGPTLLPPLQHPR